MNSSDRPRAACTFITRHGKVLAVSRRHDDGDFGLPGGKVEPGESDKQAAARETLEETSLVVSGLEPLYSGPSGNFWVSTFFVHQFAGEPRNMGDGAVEWIYPEQLMNGTHAEFNKFVIEAWKRLTKQP